MLLNFTKAELYRTFRTKAIFVLSIVLIGLFVVSNFMLLKIDMSAIIDEAELQAIQENGATAENMANSAEVGYNTGSEAADKGNGSVLIGKGLFYRKSVASLFNNNIAGLNGLLLISIFTGLFFGNIYATGADKNFTIANKRRELLFAARAITVFIINLMFILITYLVTVICCAMWAESLKLGFDADFVAYFLTSVLLSYAFSMIVATVTVLFKSKAAGITVGVLLSTGFFTLFISLIDLLVHRFTSLKSFALTDYLVEQNMMTMTLTSSDAKYIRAIVISLIYLAVAITLTVMTNRKRDIC